MTLRPAVVDPQGGPTTGNGGGPMPLAKLPVSWSHVAGKRQTPMISATNRGRLDLSQLRSFHRTDYIIVRVSSRL